jgi:hypothetical protein
MKTIETNYEAINNENCQPKWVDVKLEISNVKDQVVASISRKQEVLWDQLNDDPLDIREQHIATDLSRLFWKNPWAMLKEQLSNLWLSFDTVKETAVNNISKWVWTIKLSGQAA